ncbi:MAG: hypothetical protein L6Q98_19380 [Anaerolineae bacterium]|nr:hypothetical protein [Anaerolineae bacterium]NUQ05977.1 hypothetical protein [Anaerolineae bacterium]
MTHRIEWLIPDHLLNVVISGEITGDDILRITEDAVEAMERSPAPLVHSILHISGVSKVPTLADIAQVMQDIKPRPRSGWTLVVMATNPIIRWAADFTMQLSGVRYRRADDMGDALRQMRHLVEALDWAQLPEEYRALQQSE